MHWLWSTVNPLSPNDDCKCHLDTGPHRASQKVAHTGFRAQFSLDEGLESGACNNLRVLYLMRFMFIDPSNGPMQTGICNVLKKTCKILRNVLAFRSCPSLGEVLHENRSYSDPQLLGFWVIMNTVNGIAQGGPPHVPVSLVPVPPSLTQ